MLSRLSLAERVSAAAALAGVIASFLTWYGYDDGTAQITVDGFRASLLGDLFFAACVTLLMVHANRARLLQLGRIDPKVTSIATTVAAACAGLQLILVFMAGHSIHKGLLLAVVAAVTLVVAASQAEALNGRGDTVI